MRVLPVVPSTAAEPQLITFFFSLQRADQCIECRGHEDDGTCVTSCPVGKWADGNLECQECDSMCSDEGCDGPVSEQDLYYKI